MDNELNISNFDLEVSENNNPEIEDGNDIDSIIPDDLDPTGNLLDEDSDLF